MSSNIITVSFKDGFTGGLVLGLGFFDAVHAGHRALLECVSERARELSRENEHVLPAVFTFSNNMAEFFKPGEKLVYTFPERLRIFETCGMSAVIFAEMNRDFAELGGISFLDELTSRFDIRAVFTGNDYCFGKGGGCGVSVLRAYFAARNAETRIIEFVTHGGIIKTERGDEKKEGRFSDENHTEEYSAGEVSDRACEKKELRFSDENYAEEKSFVYKISSSEIRALISEGNISDANRLLGAPYFVSGKVRRCHGRGGGLGFPTANIMPAADKLKLQEGVYATLTEVDGKNFFSVTSVGSRPTFAEYEYVLETFIKDFYGDLYEKEITVYFVRRLRGLRKFTSPEELRRQISIDLCDACR